MVIREVVEAKYKANKPIVLHLLRMYNISIFPWLFCASMWMHNLPQQICLVKYWVNFEAS